MARSYRKTNFVPFTSASSEKKDKQIYNRKLRRRVKSLLDVNDYENLPDLKEISNTLTMAKDGKVLIDDEIRSYDPEYYEKLLRK